MIEISSITVGSDFECPIQLVSGEFFPVTGLIGGTKNKPRPIPRLPEGFFMQEDNVNAEFNIPACRDGLSFQRAIERALKAARAQLPPTMTLRTDVSVMEYRAEFLNNKACQEFGCTPDYNAYTREENPRPRAKNSTMRTAAAHIHVGWDGAVNDDRIRMVKMMDLTIGLSQLGRDDIRRKEMYGKAGAFRPKEYGIEYRVVDNKWLENYPRGIFDGVIRAAQLVNEGKTLTEKQEAAVIAAINTGEVSNELHALMRSIGEW